MPEELDLTPEQDEALNRSVDSRVGQKAPPDRVRPPEEPTAWPHGFWNDVPERHRPRKYMRVPLGTPGAEEKRDSAGRRYADLEKTGDIPQQMTTPHAAPAPKPERTVQQQPPVNRPGSTRTLPPQEAAAADEQALQAASAPMRAPKDRSAAAQSLSSSRALHRAEMGEKAGLNSSWLVTLEDGNKGVFKPSSGETPSHESNLAGVRPGTFWKREIAASRVADILGMNDIVPLTVPRHEGNSTGSMQQYAEAADEACNVGEAERFDGNEDAARAAAFDYLIGNTDRHQANWMKADSGKLVLIDNGTSFPNQYHPDGFFHVQIRQHAGQKGLRVPDVGEDRWNDIEDVLSEIGIEPEAIALTRNRYRQLLEHKGMSFADLPPLSREKTR